jgi:L-alanine-DL-glutamate epimerase-like enolase superfamily enzyme
MQMRVTAAPLQLTLRDPFTLSYGTSTARTNVLIQIAAQGHVGLGEAALPPYYGVSAAEIIAEVDAPRVAAALNEAAVTLEGWLAALDALALTHGPTRAALDTALHDLWGKLCQKPLHVLWDLDVAAAPRSSFTVAMDDDTARYRRRVRAAGGYPLVKLKLGCGDPERDLSYLEAAVEELGSTPVCLDANGAWSAVETLGLLPRLNRWAPVYIEQPVARSDMEGWRELKAGLPGLRRGHGTLPLFLADESVQGVEDLEWIAGLVDGINIKLSKCGGLARGRKMVARARSLGLRVLIGCMIESSVGISAAALLCPAAQFADLDGNLLVSNDPFAGVKATGAGEIRFTSAPGIGITPTAT